MLTDEQLTDMERLVETSRRGCEETLDDGASLSPRGHCRCEPCRALRDLQRLPHYPALLASARRLARLECGLREAIVTDGLEEDDDKWQIMVSEAERLLYHDTECVHEQALKAETKEHARSRLVLKDRDQELEHVDAQMLRALAVSHPLNGSVHKRELKKLLPEHRDPNYLPPITQRFQEAIVVIEGRISLHVSLEIHYRADGYWAWLWRDGGSALAEGPVTDTPTEAIIALADVLEGVLEETEATDD